MKYIEDFIDLVSGAGTSGFFPELNDGQSAQLVDTSNNLEDLAQPIHAAGAGYDAGLAFQTVMPAVSNFICDSISDDSFRASLGDFGQPYIVVNDGTGASGSRAYALEFDAVVAIRDLGGRFCTGTLIAPDVVLTARHCEVSTSDEVVFGDNADNPTYVAQVLSVSNPGGNDGVWFDGQDIAFVRLSQPVPSSIATPMRVAAENESLVGTSVSIFGYGLNGLGSVGHQESSDGFRWGGENELDYYGDFGGGENLFLADFDDGTDLTNTLGSTFDSDPNPLAFEALTTEGDSGGPLVALIDGTMAVVGVTSGGLDIRGEYGSIGFWTGILPFAQVVADEGGTFVGEFVPVGNSEDGPGDSVMLPEVDDHVNEISPVATELVFEADGTRLIARQTGFVGFVDSPVEKDVFQFTTPFSGRVILDARASGDNLDAAIRVYDSLGNFVAENDNAVGAPSGNLRDSQLILRNLPSGQYFVSVSAADGSNGSYRLAARATVTTSGGEPGEDFNSAARIFFGTRPTTFIGAAVEESTDEDFFQFTANRTGRIVVRTRALSGNLNTVLRGFSDDELLLDANNNYKGELDSRVSFGVVEGRNYFLRLNSVGNTSGDYRLSLRMAETMGGGATPFSLRLDSAGQQSVAVEPFAADRFTSQSDTGIGLLASM